MNDELKTVFDIIDNCFWNKKGRRKYSIYILWQITQNYSAKQSVYIIQTYSEVNMNIVFVFFMNNRSFFLYHIFLTIDF
jgi:hypothetical protein